MRCIREIFGKFFDSSIISWTYMKGDRSAYNTSELWENDDLVSSNACCLAIDNDSAFKGM